MVPPRDESKAKIDRRAERARAARARRGRRPREPHDDDGRDRAQLAQRILELAGGPLDARRDEAREAFAELRAALSEGRVRAAQPDPASPTGWRVNTWVKQGILLGLRVGALADVSADHGKMAVPRQGHAAAQEV